MTAFLLVVSVLAAFNTICIIIMAMAGPLPPVRPFARAIDALITLGLGCWAAYLLVTS